jgi:hypothetical protein
MSDIDKVLVEFLTDSAFAILPPNTKFFPEKKRPGKFRASPLQKM